MRCERMVESALRLEDGDTTQVALLGREFQSFRGLNAAIGFDHVSEICDRLIDALSAASTPEEFGSVANMVVEGCHVLTRHLQAIRDGQRKYEIPELGLEITPADELPVHGTPDELHRNGAREVNRRRSLRFQGSLADVELVVRVRAQVLDESRDGVAISLPSLLEFADGAEIELVQGDRTVLATVRRQTSHENRLILGCQWRG